MKPPVSDNLCVPCEPLYRYLVRPNPAQIEWTANYFRNNLVRINPDGSRDTSFNAATHAPPQEAICIHVRHGDKFLEMPYVLLSRDDARPSHVA
jgi:hypothetical protein